MITIVDIFWIFFFFHQVYQLEAIHQHLPERLNPHLRVQGIISAFISFFGNCHILARIVQVIEGVDEEVGVARGGLQEEVEVMQKNLVIAFIHHLIVTFHGINFAIFFMIVTPILFLDHLTILVTPGTPHILLRQPHKPQKRPLSKLRPYVL